MSVPQNQRLRNAATLVLAIILIVPITIAQVPEAAGAMTHSPSDGLTEALLLRQAASLHPPVLTPYGWQDSPAVTGAKAMLRAAARGGMADEIAARQQRVPPGPSDLTKTTSARSSQNELQALIAELNAAATINANVARSGRYATAEFLADQQRYQTAFGLLTDMLEGRTEPSITEASFAVEATYGNLYMSHAEYTAEIERSARFMRQWMQEQGYDERNPEAAHLAIQRFMGDTLTVRNTNRLDRPDQPKLPRTHKPFQYDYVDFRAEDDLRNHFLTKTLATGSGQCITLPQAYLVFAEALGVEAHLTFMPQHAFIKYRNAKGTWQNYEPTVHWHLSDNEYLDMMPVMSAALANGLYMQPLTKEQTIASAMIDLASNFQREHWMADGTFMQQCLDKAMPYFRNGEAHVLGLALRSQLITMRLDRLLQEHNITDLARISEVPEAERIYQAYRTNTRLQDDLGIQDYPEEVYNAMLEKHDTRGRLQQAKGTDLKTKRSLFSNAPKQ